MKKQSLLTLLTLLSAIVVFLSTFGAKVHAQPCCSGYTGNIDQDAGNITDITDLTFLIDHLFILLTPLPCIEEGNIDGDIAGTVDITDLTFLIDHLFITLVDPFPCICDASNSNPAELVGTWTFQSVTLNGVPELLSDILESPPGTVTSILQFGADNSATAAELDSTGNALWTGQFTFCFNGNNFTWVQISSCCPQTINHPPDLVGEDDLYMVSGNTLTLTIAELSDTLAFTLIR